MHTTRLIATAALALVAAGCGQGDSGNVMAPDVNALTPAQIDAALGPENGNASATANAANAVEPVPAQSAPAAARPAPAPREVEPPESEPANEAADEVEADNQTGEPRK